MNKLSGRKYLIASGKTSLSRSKVEGYRRIFAEQGYELPEWNPRKWIAAGRTGAKKTLKKSSPR